MNKITIQPKNPHDITTIEAEELAQVIRAALPESDVGVEAGEEQRQGTYGVTFFQIVSVALGGAAAAIGKDLLQELTKAGVQWAKSRFVKKPSIRPIYIPIYGPDGRILKSVVVKDATSEPEDRTKQDQDFQDRYSKK